MNLSPVVVTVPEPELQLEPKTPNQLCAFHGLLLSPVIQ